MSAPASPTGREGTPQSAGMGPGAARERGRETRGQPARRSSQSAQTAWVSDTAEMWKKTALRRLCKMLPMSAEDARVVTKAELADAGIAPVQDFDPVTGEVPMPEDPSVSALDAAAARAPVEAHAEVVP